MATRLDDVSVVLYCTQHRCNLIKTHFDAKVLHQESSGGDFTIDTDTVFCPTANDRGLIGSECVSMWTIDLQ